MKRRKSFLYLIRSKTGIQLSFKNKEMKFLAIESLRISLKLNISAAREQQAVGLGLLM